MDKDSVFAFDVETKKFKKLPQNLHIMPKIDKLFLLDNGNVLAFVKWHDLRFSKITEINPYTLQRENKVYYAPNLVDMAQIVKLNNGEILYNGGAHIDCISRHIRSASNKIFVWKNKE